MARAPATGQRTTFFGLIIRAGTCNRPKCFEVIRS